MNVGMRSSVCTLRHRGPPRRRLSTSGLRSVMETPKKTAVFRKIVPADGTIAACRRERNFGTFRYETAAHQNVTPLPQRTKGGGKKSALAQRIRIQPVFLSRERSGGCTPSNPIRFALPDFGKSRNLIPARCEALDHRLALFR